jgi:hypothetical protein
MKVHVQPCGELRCGRLPCQRKMEAHRGPSSCEGLRLSGLRPVCFQRGFLDQGSKEPDWVGLGLCGRRIQAGSLFLGLRWLDTALDLPLRLALFPSQATSSRSTPRHPHGHKTSLVTEELYPQPFAASRLRVSPSAMPPVRRPADVHRLLPRYFRSCIQTAIHFRLHPLGEARQAPKCLPLPLFYQSVLTAGNFFNCGI